MVPTIVPRIAWGIIDDMLEGSDPSSVTIRDSMLASPVASSAIESALERGTAYAERLLLADSVCESKIIEWIRLQYEIVANMLLIFCFRVSARALRHQR